MKVVAFHTGGPYQKEANLLECSLRSCNIDYYIKKIPITCDWDRAVSLKPAFILECRKKFEGPLLFVDVDAVFHSNPSEYFDSLNCDFAAHWFQGPSSGYDRSRNDNYFLSGTMFWADSLNARLLLDAWLSLNKQKQALGIWEGGGQANLNAVIEASVVNGLRIVKLPGRYCYVFDKSWAYPEGEQVIIELLIASRENRGPSKGKVNLLRRKRIAVLRRGFQC